MREYRDYMQEDAARPFSLGAYPVTAGLILANVAVFFLAMIVVNAILPHVTRWDFTLADLEWYLGVVPEKTIGSLWLWQPLTYSFLHDPQNLWHLLINMVVLYFFGCEVEALYGSRRFLFLYLGGAVFAGLCHCIDYGLGTPAIGASGATYAVMTVFALHYPKREIRFMFLVPIEAWLVVLLMIGFDLSLYFTNGGRDQVAHLAHLGGCVAGWLFYRYGAALEGLSVSVEARVAAPRPSRADRAQARAQGAEKALEAELDRVLEKINREGMGALTPKEREVLERASKHYQKRS